MRRLTIILSILLVSATLFAQGRTVKILAIGNSFSEDAVEQNLHELAAAGFTTVIGNMYIPGCPLELHARNIRQDARA